MLVFAIQQHKSAVIMYTPPPSPASLYLPHPIPPGHHRAPDWTPCATSQPLTTDPSHTRSGHVLMFLSPLSHPLPPPLCPQVHSLPLCLLSFPANRFIAKDTCTPLFTAALFIKARVHLFYEAVSTTLPFWASLFHLSNEVDMFTLFSLRPVSGLENLVVWAFGVFLCIVQLWRLILCLPWHFFFLATFSGKSKKHPSDAL